MFLLFLSLFSSIAYGITINVVLPRGIDCLTVPSPFVSSVAPCVVTPPEIDVLRAVEGMWKETGSDSNWEYAPNGTCAFTCGSAASFAACQSNAGVSSTLNFYPPSQCCFSNCSVAQTTSTRNAATTQVRKAYRLPSSNITLNTSRVCSTKIPYSLGDASVYQCALPDSVNEADVLIHSHSRNFSLLLTNVIADKWMYSDFSVYNEPYLFRFSQPQNGSGCNNTDGVLKDMMFTQHICTTNLSATVFFGENLYFARGFWFGTTNNASLASNLTIRANTRAVYDSLVGNTGLQTVSNNSYVNFSSQLQNLVELDLIAPSDRRIELTELRLDLFANSCPAFFAPAYGAMVCSMAPPETAGSICNFGCWPGFQSNDPNSSTCLGSDIYAPSWSSSSFTCNPVTCPSITRPLNGNYSCTNGSYGTGLYTSICTFTCQPGFSLSHTRAFNCSTSGLWNDTVPTCNNINDCNATACGPGSTCYDGVQRVYCGLTIKPSSLRVLSGGSLQTNVVNLNSVAGGAVVAFDLNLNDVRQEDLLDVRYGNSKFPTLYQCLNFTLFSNGTVSCIPDSGVGVNLSFTVLYTMKIVKGEEADAREPGSYLSQDRTLTYPLPQFVNKTLRINEDSSLYEGNPLIGRTTLGEVIEFLGSNFIPISYPKLMIYYGSPAGSRNYTCSLDSNSPITTTQMRCKTQSGGQGSRLVFDLVVMDDINVYSGDTYSYPVPPKVTRVSGCSDVGITTQNCPTQGTVITVQGIGFTSGAKVTVSPPAVTPTVFNSTYLTFVLGPGAGANLPVVVRAADQDSDGSSSWLSYAPPTVLNVTGTGCISNTTGVTQCPKLGTTLTFTGKDFGRAVSPVDVLIGTTTCTNVTYLVEHFQFTCQLGPGSRQQLAITLIQTGGLLGQSSTLSVSYYQCQAGTYINDNDGGKCYNCPANYYTIIEGRTDCIACDAGQYSPGGQPLCSVCPVGTSSVGGQDCVACLPGTYAPNQGQKQNCVACPSGRFSNSSGASDCYKCLPGSSQKLTNATSCDTCDLGKSQRSTEETGCDLCDAGFFANMTGLSDCLACEPGSFTNRSGQSSCLLCEQGKASQAYSAVACGVCQPGQMASSDSDGATACLDCAPGFAQLLEQQTECDPCDSGFFSGPKQSMCTPCVPGRFSRDQNSSDCKDCSSGSYAAGSAASMCGLCGVGTFSAFPDVTGCTNCTAGKYSASSNSSSCIQCVPGRAQSMPRSSSCTICPIGRYFAFSEATSCLLCDPGSFANSTNSTGCFSCAAGRYSLSGQATCQACPVGRATFAASQGNCTDCPNGKFASSVASSVCADCISGLIQELPGQSSCHECQTGYYANSSSNCVICSSGRYSNSSKQIVCIDCLPGSFSNQNGRSSCELCLPGTFLDSSGKTGCETCPLGTISRGSAATRCEACEAPKEVNGRDCVCPFSTYLSEDDTCLLCPRGAECQSAGLEYRTLKAAAGYWRSPLTTSPVFYKCLTLTHCPEQPYSFDPTERNDLNYSSIVCGPHRRGPICALCVDGFKSATVVSTCVDCANDTKGTALSVLIIIGMVIALGIAYWFLLRADKQLLLSQQAVVAAHGDIKLSRATSTPVDALRRLPATPKPAAARHLDSDLYEDSVNSPKPSKTSFDFDDDNYIVPFLHTNRRGGGKETGQIKIIIGFFQIIYNLTAVRNLSWPAGFKMVVSAFSFINLDFIPWNTVGCAVPFNFYVRITVIALSPFVIMTLVFFAYFLPSFWKDTRDFSDHDLARVVRHQKRNQLKKMFLFALFLMYPFISREVLSFFLCDNVDGVDYLVPDFNLQCYDALWKSWLAPVIVMIVIYPIGCPLTVLLLLYQHAKRDLLDTDFVRIGYGFLYEPYQNPRWWFEFLDMVHKIILTSVLNFFPDSAQLPVALVVVGLYTMALLLFTPYIEDSDDSFHFLAQAEIFNIIMCAWVLQTYTLVPGSVEEILLSILLCVLLFTLILELIRRFIIKLRPHYHKARKVLRESRGSNAPGQNLTSNLASIESKIEQNAYKLSVDDEDL